MDKGQQRKSSDYYTAYALNQMEQKSANSMDKGQHHKSSDYYTAYALYQMEQKYANSMDKGHLQNSSDYYTAYALSQMGQHGLGLPKGLAPNPHAPPYSLSWKYSTPSSLSMPDRRGRSYSLSWKYCIPSSMSLPGRRGRMAGHPADCPAACPVRVGAVAAPLAPLREQRRRSRQQDGMRQRGPRKSLAAGRIGWSVRNRPQYLDQRVVRGENWP